MRVDETLSAPAWISFRVSFGTFDTFKLMEDKTLRLLSIRLVLSVTLLNCLDNWRLLLVLGAVKLFVGSESEAWVLPQI